MCAIDDECALKITISPEPTADERDAVVAALTVLLLAGGPEPVVSAVLTSRWTRVGRVEAMRGIDRLPDRGWRRARS